MSFRSGLALLSAALLITACGKPAETPATSSDAASQTPAAAPAAAPDAEAIKARLASLPAPYSTADIDAGKTKFALCRSCHTIAQGGAAMTGPNLYGIVGKTAASVEGFSYSDALKAANLTWDPANIDRYITDPKAMVPGNKMSFLGIKDAQDRTNLIAYLMVEAAPAP